MYIYIKDNIVWEFVPEENPELPGVPLDQRYPQEFLDALVYVESPDGIEYGYIYDAETGTFVEPPEPEYIEPEEPSEAEPTQLDRIEAQLTYTAMMTDTLLEV